METGKLRHAIIAALASFFALSLAFAGEEDKAAATEATAEAVECAEEDVACVAEAAIAEAVKEETAAMEMEEEEEAEEAE